MTPRRLAPALLLAACHAPNSPGFTSVHFSDGSTGSTGSSSEAGPGSSATDETSTDETSEESADPGQSSTAAPEGSPEILAFTITPKTVEQAQSVQLAVDVSPDVETIEVYFDGAAEPHATLTPAQFPYDFAVTSQSVCHGAAAFLLVARNAEGHAATAEEKISCELPASGSDVFTSAKAAGAGQALALLPGGEAMIGGVLGDQVALWLVDPSGAILDGWPRQLKDLSNFPQAMLSPSRLRALAPDPTGVVLAAEVIEDGVPRRLVMRLKHNGARVWEDLGAPGEEVSSAAVAADGTIFIGGRIQVGLVQKKPTYDAAGWGYLKGYPDASVWTVQFGAPLSDPQPDMDNLRSESGRGVVYLSSGLFVLAGDREFADDDTYMRSFTQAVSTTGAPVGDMWTSDGIDFKHNALLSVKPTKVGFAGVGYAHHMGQPEQIYVQQFASPGERVLAFISPTPSMARGLGIATDREEKLVIVGHIAAGNHTDGFMQALPGPGITPSWTVVFDDQGSNDALTAVGCDAWGYCTAAGLRVTDGTMNLLYTRRYP